MAIIETQPIAGQKPGTSGLRKRVTEFLRPGYAENYLQSIFDCLPTGNRELLIVGGDGRYPGPVVTDLVLRMAAANGFRRAITGVNGWLSTPATSHLVRKYQASAAIVLTASHNPGGPQGDFGIKLNRANGGPASDGFANEIYQRSLSISRYCIADEAGPDLAEPGHHRIGAMKIDVIDPVQDYNALMQRLFDFDALAKLATSGLRIMFDGLNGVAGPYAREILVNTIGFPEHCLMRSDPLPDFGGQHPDPNPIYAGHFHAAMMSRSAPDFGAACDSDADRHMIMGRGVYVTPSDSLAILAQHMHVAPAYTAGIVGVARSLGTSTAIDRVAAHMKVPCFETPTGWKYFGNLLDAELITLCGEESSGAGSTHIREKDGLWAVLLWLSIIAAKRKSVAELLSDHWSQFGRTYYERRDYEEIDGGACHTMLNRLRRLLPRLSSKPTILGEVTSARDFTYCDPVDGSTTEHQGITLLFASGARVVLRLSGTGTSGATLRLYGERHDPKRFDRIPGEFLETLFDVTDQIAGVSSITRQYAPTLIT